MAGNCNIHCAKVYNTLLQLLEAMECAPGVKYDNPPIGWDENKARRYWTKVWKRHIEKNGNVPLIMKCAICSGKEQKLDIKHGKWKPSRPTKAERDEVRGKDENEGH